MKQRTKQNNTQKGFAHIGVVIAVVAVVAALAFGGWYVWDKNKEDKKSTDSSSQNNKQEEQKQSDPSEDEKYLVIKEWDVRFELPEELKGDISYSMNNQAEIDFGGPIRVDILSRKLKCAAVSLYYEELGANDSADYDPQPFKVLDGKGYVFSNTSCEETINREGTVGDKQLITDLKKTISETLETVSN